MIERSSALPHANERFLRALLAQVVIARKANAESDHALSVAMKQKREGFFIASRRHTAH